MHKPAHKRHWQNMIAKRRAQSAGAPPGLDADVKFVEHAPMGIRIDFSNTSRRIFHAGCGSSIASSSRFLPV
jgi:hypothetical protein